LKVHEADRRAREPGREYQETRHNVGFRVADEIAKRRNLQWRADSDWMFAKDFGSPGFLVMKPLTFMNLSGFAVSRFVDYHRIDLTDLLVAFDEVDWSSDASACFRQVRRERTTA
jgi:PTH1 family peptidyl-tRNA hydrolase